MPKIALTALVSAALLCGCPRSGENDGALNPPDEQAIPDTAIVVYGYAEPQAPVATGKASYQITCGLAYSDFTKDNSDFNSAAVSVNGIALNRKSDGVFTASNPVELSEGDTVSFVLKHSKVGTVKEKIMVPASVPDFTISPALPQSGTLNGRAAYFLSWNRVNADQYYAAALAYDSLKQGVVQVAINTGKDTCTVIAHDLSGRPYPFLRIWVSTYNLVSLTGFGGLSRFKVSGTYYKSYSNL